MFFKVAKTQGFIPISLFTSFYVILLLGLRYDILKHLQPALTLTTLSLHHHHHHSFLLNLPQIIHHRVRDDEIYRYLNSVVVVVDASWRYGRHSHVVCTRSMFAVQLYVYERVSRRREIYMP